MSPKPISQREARALKRRVRELEQRDRELRSAFSSTYPGAWLAQCTVSEHLAACLGTAKRLGHVVVAKIYDGGVNYYAIPTEARSNV